MHPHTGRTQKQSLISSSYKIKTYWNIFINMGLQILRWHLAVRTFLNQHLPNRWIGRAGQNDQVLCKWPPRSPDLNVCDFFLWGYVNGRVHVPPLHSTCQTNGLAALDKMTRCCASDPRDRRT